MKLDDYMKRYNEEELEKIYYDFVEFKNDGVTGNTFLRSSAEDYEEIIKDLQIKTGTMTWLINIGDYATSYFAKKYFEDKNKCLL